VLDAAAKHGRRVFVTGRSMVNNVNMARDLGYLRSPGNIFMGVNEMRNHPDATDDHHLHRLAG
jgi:ribonuclease J